MKLFGIGLPLKVKMYTFKMIQGPSEKQFPTLEGFFVSLGKINSIQSFEIETNHSMFQSYLWNDLLFLKKNKILLCKKKKEKKIT